MGLWPIQPAALSLKMARALEYVRAHVVLKAQGR